MSGYERRFDQLRSTGRLQSAFTRWRERQEFLMTFSDSESLISTFRSRQDESRLLKHLGLLAICFEAREGDEDAFLLLVGLYLPTFRRLRREIGPCLLEEEDLEAEMIAGFWEALSDARSLARNSAAALFHGPQHRAWKAVAQAGQKRKWTDEMEDGSCQESADGRDAIRLVEEAVEAGVLEGSEAALILATRLGKEPVAELAEASGERRDSLSRRRKRAERRLAEWLAQES